MSERALLADILAMIAGGAIVIWGVSLFWEPALWALLPWLAIGAYIVYRYRPQWFAWARELPMGISRITTAWNKFIRVADKLDTTANSGHSGAKSGHHVDEMANTEHVAPVMFAAATRKPFWTGVIAFARVLANFPILWVGAAVLFGLAWGELKYHAGRRAGQQELRTMQAEAVIRSARAQAGHDARSRDIGAVHEAAKQSTTRILARANEESERVDPTDLAALWDHHDRAMRELRDEADASAAAALEAYDRSLAS